MDDMNRSKLQELSEEVLSLLKKYDISSEEFGFNIYVSKAYFDSIKDTFITKPFGVVYSTVTGPRWSLNIFYAPIFDKSTHEEST